jgi:flagellar basal body-associated protein FliL
MPGCWRSSGDAFKFSRRSILVEIWIILLIVLLLFPAFLAANYFIVKKMAAEKRSRDERIERAVSDSVARSFREKGARYQSWPKYKAGRKR